MIIEAHTGNPADGCRPNASCLAAFLAAVEPGIYMHCGYNGAPHGGQGPGRQPPGVYDLLGVTSFPESDRFLGAPNGSATETAPGSNVWRRFFGDQRNPTVVEWDENRQAGHIDWAGSGPTPPPVPTPVPVPPPQPHSLHVD